MKEKKRINQRKLSERNELLSYFYVKGIKFQITKTQKNKNGSWSMTVKNTAMEYGFNRFKKIGYKDLEQLILQYKHENKHLF